MLESLQPEWNAQVSLPVQSKISILNNIKPAVITNAFPWRNMLSEGINFQLFTDSFFTQPDLFIRIRPGYEAAVEKKLEGAGIKLRQVDKHTLAVPNLTKLDNIISIDEEAIIQDYSSQQVSTFLKPVKENTKPVIKIWDCCAASGGKSILAKDYFGDIDLTVSDIRQSILANLQTRFKKADIVQYKSFVADVTNTNIHADKKGYDLLICDAPCSGSGTWARTPEQLYYWQEGKLEYYTALQKKIITNVAPFVKPGGYFLYITCSVFKEENEDIVKEILNTTEFALVDMQVIKGYDVKADTMFGALFKRKQRD